MELLMAVGVGAALGVCLTVAVGGAVYALRGPHKPLVIEERIDPEDRADLVIGRAIRLGRWAGGDGVNVWYQGGFQFRVLGPGFSHSSLSLKQLHADLAARAHQAETQARA